jgi:hypothetical protein
VFSHKSFLTKSFSPIGWKTIEVPSLPSVSGVYGGGKKGTPFSRQWVEDIADVSHLHAEDQIVTELLVALVTKGFFHGHT